MLEIKLNDAQLTIMREALEFYSRFISGQVDNLPDVLRFDRQLDRDEFRRVANEMKAVLFPGLRQNEAFGVGHIDKNYPNRTRHRQISYECYRQIYVFQTAEAKAQGADVKWNVYDSPTLAYSGEPLIQIKRATEEETIKIHSA